MEPTQECCVLFWRNSGSNTSQNITDKTTYFPSYKQSESDEQDMLGTGIEVRTNSYVAFFNRFRHMDTLMMKEQ